MSDQTHLLEPALDPNERFLVRCIGLIPGVVSITDLIEVGLSAAGRIPPIGPFEAWITIAIAPLCFWVSARMWRLGGR